MSDYKSSGSLVGGAPLEVEDLDLANFGLYNEEQRFALISQGVPEDDFIPAKDVLGRWGTGFYARKSDEGVKRHTFDDTEIKLHKALGKKDDENV